MKNKLSNRFELASEEYNYRTICSIDGEVGTGKTYFGLTGPAPILVQNIDKGLEFVVEEFIKDGKEIYDGDIVEGPAKRLCGSKNEWWPVKDNGVFGFYPFNVFHDISFHPDLKVVGNIHENPGFIFG